MNSANLKYKDRLFNAIFGAEENKSWTLSLYNAVSGSSYTDPSAITITTIHEIMYLSMHNDVSFLIGNEMNLYEQQSTYNPNMPLRMLMYIGHLYDKYLREEKLNRYSSQLLRIPAPKLVVFYNGMKEQPEKTTLKLSDAYPEGISGAVEAVVLMLNINSGRNKELMEACKPLAEYAWFVEEVRKNTRNTDKESRVLAVDRAITAVPDDFLIKPFLEVHRAEVRGMILEEYNEAEQMELFRQDGVKEGREKGRKEGQKEGKILGTIETMRDDGKDDQAIIVRLIKKYGLTEKEAEGYVF